MLSSQITRHFCRDMAYSGSSNSELGMGLFAGTAACIEMSMMELQAPIDTINSNLNQPVENTALHKHADLLERESN